MMTGVSLVIPAHDRAATLPRAICSCLEQTAGDLEVVVVDDGSTDDTARVVEEIDDPRVRLQRFESQRGANAARNAGVRASRGDLVSFLDSDDQLHPRHVERVLGVFGSKGTDCHGVFTAYQLVRGGRVTHVSSPAESYVSYTDMLSDNVIGVFSCVTLRSSVFDEVLPDEDLECWQDYDFFLRVLRRGYRMHGLAETLVSCHESSGRIGEDVGRAERGTRRFREKHGEELAPRGRSKLSYYWACAYARAGRLRDARAAFAESIRHDPARWLAYLHLAASLHPSASTALFGAKRAFRALNIRAAGRSWRGGIPGSV